MLNSQIFKRSLLGLSLCLMLILLFSTEAKSQKYVGFQLHTVYAFELEPLSIFNSQVKIDNSMGYQCLAFFSYRFKKQGLEPRFSAGLKYLQFEGEFDDQEIHGESYKLNLILGLDYRFYKNWILGLDFLTENNLDFELFRAANSDLLRYNLQGRISYKLSKKWMASLAYSKILYPRVNHFLIANPSNQIYMGLTYKLFKL